MESDKIEKKIVSLQLGRELKNDFRVARVCEWGFPQVIESSLISYGKPFPTLFWLSCPFLKEKVSRLESGGMITEFEKRIERDGVFADEYLKAHEETTLIKKRILGRCTLSESQKLLLLVRGIGGIRNLKMVKCLHLQLANFLGGVNNPIGREVWSLLERTRCSSERVICRELLNRNE